MTSATKTERRLDWRRRTLLGAWLLACILLVARAVELQLLEGSEWRAVADGQHKLSVEVPAPRGAILDRDGAPLAVSRENFKVSVAPRELTDAADMRVLLTETLGISGRTARRATDDTRKWVVVPGVFGPSVRDALSGVRGVYLERVLRRDHPYEDLAMGVLGRVLDGAGAGGIEQAFDSILSGRPGREVLARDSEGKPLPGQVFEMEPPVPGGDVTLTIDVDLQEIASQALREAVEAHGARGGDIIVSDPFTGDILSLVSMSEGRTDALSAIHTPYEPGSTLKPFTVAAILQHRRGSLQDSIDVENGSWAVNGRVLNDVHASGVMSLADALRISSNVGVAKAAQALAPQEQFETLRDFGFGVPTGLPLPGEDRGVLRRPSDWTRMSPQSLAIGYEMSVTPIQLVMAYGALANGGRLMEPRLLRSASASPGRSVEPEPVVIRRAVRESVTREIGEVLMDVVEDGTGTEAQLGTFHVAGKSGTSRAFGPEGYESGRYFSSFVGYFPAEDPQLVIYVKLDGAEGAYYGGAVAAPVTRATMEAALAARQSPLDRRQLAEVALLPQGGSPIDPARFAAFEERWNDLTREETSGAPLVSGQAVPVPDVRGLPARVAIRRLHALGLRVSWEESGAIIGTVPAAGVRLSAGDTVRLRTGRTDR